MRISPLAPRLHRGSGRISQSVVSAELVVCAGTPEPEPQACLEAKIISVVATLIIKTNKPKRVSAYQRKVDRTKRRDRTISELNAHQPREKVKSTCSLVPENVRPSHVLIVAGNSRPASTDDVHVTSQRAQHRNATLIIKEQRMAPTYAGFCLSCLVLIYSVSSARDVGVAPPLAGG
jgi:hypothetical protein